MSPPTHLLTIPICTFFFLVVDTQNAIDLFLPTTTTTKLCHFLSRGIFENGNLIFFGFFFFLFIFFENENSFIVVHVSPKFRSSSKYYVTSNTTIQRNLEKKKQNKICWFFFFSRIRAPGVEYWLQQLGSVHRYNFFKIISKQKKKFLVCLFSFFSFYPKFDDDAKTQNFPLCILLLKLLFCFFFFGLSISIDRILVVVDRFLF